MTARKLFIILITVAGLLMLYIIYSSFSGAPGFIGSKGIRRAGGQKMADVNGTMGKIGGASVGTVVKSVYIDYDEHKNVKREFGFARLLHESGNEWTIEKPYMNIIEKDFVCGITADTGKVQVEMIAGKPSPKDAQLLGNVVVHILPDKGLRFSESFVYLDDIRFVSEKSLFTTDGPVRFVSADAEMASKGLEVIYNSGKDRVELMQLGKLEYLRLKTFDESLFAKRSEVVADQQPKEASATQSDKQSNEQYYKCTLNKNVVIMYGDQTVLADEVTISNLFWPKSKGGSAKKAGAAKESVKDANGSTHKVVPVIITCESSVILRPMKEVSSASNTGDVPQRTLELLGTPVVIKAGDIASVSSNADGSGRRVLAECGWLKYNLDLGILDMFTRGQQKYVSLNLEQDGSKLETTDSLSWRIKDRKAVVRGPGTLYLPDRTAAAGGQKRDADKARMNFGGTMNVSFADDMSAENLKQAINIKSVNLAGGFTAAMQNDTAHLAADSATFNFGGGNSISDASLDGNVNFNSNSGSLHTEKARLVFAQENAISEADLDGNVNFDSKSGSGKAQKAKVLFGKGNTISEADLNGNVNFDSGTGSLKSQNAKVMFTKDSKGNVYASSVQSFGNVEIIPAPVKGHPGQGVFRAQRIDYDIPKGYAVADGPVKLTFVAGGKAGGDANGMPVTITANKKAEYFLKSNEVIFEGDAHGIMEGRSNTFSEFYGDKIIATVGRTNKDKAESDALAGSGVDHLAITGDIVKFETYQKQKDKVIGGVTLKCRQVDYDGVKNEVLATGSSDSVVKIDNSKAPEAQKGGMRFNLKGPCYALLSSFEKVHWQVKDNIIIADGAAGGMHFNYVPVTTGKDGKPVQIDTSHAQLDLVQTPDGRQQISALKAGGGIHYREEDSYEFFGDELNYDGNKSFISVTGNSAKPCMINGVIFDGISYDLANGNMQTQGLRGGSVPVPAKKPK